MPERPRPWQARKGRASACPRHGLAFKSPLVTVSPRAIRIASKNIHLDSGELAAGVVTCAPGEPLTLELGIAPSADIVLPDAAHVALGRFDPHVHFRECVVPTRQEVAEHGPADVPYEELVARIEAANRLYSLRAGSLSALRGGVCAVGAMGNTPWGPVGAYRHRRTQEHYTANSLIPIVVWPRMEPGVPAIAGHEGKDFGSTFGGSGLAGDARRAMFELWRGEAVSYHNDQARAGESIAAFKKRVQPDDILLHHEYFDGQTVVDSQAETMRIAREAGVSSLLARHIPTGPAVQQILDARAVMPFALPLEIGLDYVYWCHERILTQKREIALINYRRPAHPSRADQQSLIEIARDTARAGYEIFFGTDHAPHPLASKRFKDGLPGSPGTRNIEHSLQLHMELVRNYGYAWSDIDRLAAINPAKRMARYLNFPYEVGEMRSGAMANLAIFDPDAPYSVDERALATQLDDPHYHSALTGETGLWGKSLFTVVDGRVWDVQGAIRAVN